jgi:hypothetical protein
MGNRKTMIVLLLAMTMMLPAGALLASGNANAAPASGWSATVVDNSQSWDPNSKQIVADHAGHMHIAWDYGNKIYYATNKSGAWVTTELDKFTTDNKYSPTIVVNSTNTVFISFGVFYYADYHFQMKMAVINPTATSASIEMVDANQSDWNGDYGETAMYVDPITNLVHIFYSFSDSASDQFVEVIRNSANSYSARNTLLAYNVAQENVVVASDGSAYLVFQHSNDIYYGIRPAAGSFTFGMAINLGNGLDSSNRIALALDSSKNMHISYADYAADEYRYCNNIGASAGGLWPTTNMATIASSSGSYYNYDTAIFMKSNVPYVAYRKDNSLHVDSLSAGAFTTTSPIETSVGSKIYGKGVSEVTFNGHVFLATTGYDDISAHSAIRLVADIVLPGLPLTPMGTGGNNQVNVTYGAASTNGGPDIAYYNIYRANVIDLEIYVGHSVGPVLYYLDTGVSNDITYYYKISAVNANGGEGPKTEEFSATPQSMPSAPTGIAVTNPSNHLVHLSWVPASTNGGPDISDYYIFRSTVTGNEAYLGHTSIGTATSYDDTNLTNAQTYFYTVSAVNSHGWSPNSTEVNITPYWTPSAPAFTATSGNGQVVLSWTVPSDKGGYATIDNYTLYSGSYPTLTLLANVSGSTMTYTKTGLTNGQAYYFAIAGVNAKGEGLKSFANATPSASPQAPTAPLNVQATGGSGSITLTWTVPTSTGTQPITDFKIYRGDSATSLAYKDHTGSAALTYTDSGLMNARTYYYTVVAVNSVGDSPQSASAHATTSSTSPDGAPGTISDVSVSSNDNSVDVSWTAPDQGASAITHYYVYRAETNDPSQATLIANLSGSALNFQDTTAVNGKTYYYWVVTSNSIGASDAAASQSVVPAAKSGSSLLPIIIVVVVVIVIVVLVLFLFMRKKKATPAAPPAGASQYQQPVQQQYQQQPASVSGMCPKCGTPVGSDFAVCPNCGNKLR